MTSDLKALLNEKKRAFRSNDRVQLKLVQGQIKHRIKESKDFYRRKLEKSLENNNSRDVWSGITKISGFQRKGGVVEGNVQQVNEFNQFFNRFDSASSSSSGHLTIATSITSSGPPPSSVSSTTFGPLSGSLSSPTNFSVHFSQTCHVRLDMTSVMSDWNIYTI